MCVVRCDQVRLNRASRTDKGVHALSIKVLTAKEWGKRQELMKKYGKEDF